MTLKLIKLGVVLPHDEIGVDLIAILAILSGNRFRTGGRATTTGGGNSAESISPS